MGLTVNILTSGFLVTVIIFFVLMGILFYLSSSKMRDVINDQDSDRNDLELLESAYGSMRIAYILAFIGAGVSLLLAVLYAGHEIVISPSEYWHLALYLITYALLIISVIYAFLGLNKLYNLGIEDRNGADAYAWAGLLMSVFGFVGLTATGSGRLGMNIVRKETTERVASVESKINEHLPAIRGKVEEHLEPIRERVESDLPVVRSQIEQHLPTVRGKVDELHAQSFAGSAPVLKKNFSQEINTPASSCGCKR